MATGQDRGREAWEAALRAVTLSLADTPGDEIAADLAGLSRDQLGDALVYLATVTAGVMEDVAATLGHPSGGSGLWREVWCPALVAGIDHTVG